MAAPAPPPAPPGVPPPQVSTDLLLAAGRERTALLSGFLAGLCVFFAPMAVLAVGLLAAYLVYVASDGSAAAPVFGSGRPIEAEDFRAVFRPAVSEAPLLLCAGAIGALLAQFRRWLTMRTEPAALAAGIRPFLPEFAFLYATLVVATLALAQVRGGWPQLHRLVAAAPVYLLFMVCATWLAHAVWQYCFRNLMDLFSSSDERAAAAALRQRARLPRLHRRQV